jgi:hypothetical protein
LAATGVPMKLWSAMPSKIAKIMGLNIPMPGSARRPNDDAAIAAVNRRPGQIAPPFPV